MRGLKAVIPIGKQTIPSWNLVKHKTLDLVIDIQKSLVDSIHMPKPKHRFRNKDIESALNKLKEAKAIDHFAFYHDGKCWEVDKKEWKHSPLYIELKDVNSLEHASLMERTIHALYMDIDKSREEQDRQVDGIVEAVDKLNLLPKIP